MTRLLSCRDLQQTHRQKLCRPLPVGWVPVDAVKMDIDAGAGWQVIAPKLDVLFEDPQRAP